MDFTAFLVLPFSAVIGFATLIGAALAGRAQPRLIWPCLFSTLVAALLLLGFPTPAALGLWLLSLLAMAFSAAIGTVIGAAVARGAIAILGVRKRR
jgi:hypothetical protein